MIDWTAKRALITGAGSGIGRALAESLAGRGAHVIAADIDGDAASATAAATGGTAIAIDLANPAAPAALIAEVAAGGALDFVASNAGVGRNKRLLKEDLDAAFIERLFAVNLFAGLRLAQAYVAHAEAAGIRGRLLLTGSENSLSVPAAVKGFGFGLYAASKHALLASAEWLRDEVAGAGKPLDLHVLLPGGVFTGMTGGGLTADPATWPPEFAMMTAERCAELALSGMDVGLFHIPTHAHLADDMRARQASIATALTALGLA